MAVFETGNVGSFDTYASPFRNDLGYFAVA